MQHKRESDLQTHLEELEKRIFDSTNAEFINDALNEMKIKQQLIVFHKEEAKGLMLRTKTRWKERCEKPMKYFFNLEKKNYDRKKK